MILKQSTARKIPFFMVDSTDSITGKTGLSPTVTLSKDGAAFGAAGGSVTEIGNGWYYLNANTTDTGTLGSFALHATATGADPADSLHEVCVDLPGGSVSSVTGAVGSVTGNVGGNIVGSVASVTAVVSANLTQILGTALTETAGQIAAAFKQFFNIASPTSTMNTITTVTTTTTATNLTTNNDKTGYALSTAGNKAIWDVLTSTLTTVGSIGKWVLDNLNAAVGSIPTNPLLTNDSRLNNLDATISSRNATAPDNASITAIKAKTDNLPASPAATSDIPASNIAAIKAKTDNLPTDPADASDIAAATLAIYNRIGAPAGASLASDIAAVKTDVDAIPTNPLRTNDSRLDNLDAAISSRLAAGAQVEIKKNVAFSNFPFKMVDSSGNPATGLTVIVQRSIDGGSFANCTNAASEMSGGWYKINLSAADLNGSAIALKFTASGAKQLDCTVVTQA